MVTQMTLTLRDPGLLPKLTPGPWAGMARQGQGALSTKEQKPSCLLFLDTVFSLLESMDCLDIV